MDDNREEIVARVVGALLDETLTVQEHVDAGIAGSVGHLLHGECLRGDVHPFAQHAPILVGHPQQHADGLEGKLRGHVDDQVASTPFAGGGRHAVEDVVGSGYEVIANPPDHLWGEALVHQLSDPLVTGIVHHVEEFPAHLHVINGGSAVGAIASGMAGVDLWIAEYLKHQFMRAHTPEALAIGGSVGGLVPPNRGMLAQLNKCIVGKPVDKGLIAAEVGYVERGHQPSLRGCGTVKPASSSSASKALMKNLSPSPISTERTSTS